MTQNQNVKKGNGIDGRVQGIPGFTFKQAIQLMVGFLIVFIAGASLVEIVPAGFVFPVLIGMALAMGFLAVSIQYGKKSKSNKTFWLVGSLLSVLSLIILSIYYYLNILI